MENLINKDYSPEQVVGVLKSNKSALVSHESIYQYIWKDKKQGGSLHAHLRNKGKRYKKKRGNKNLAEPIKNRVSIDFRPKIVEKRERFGDLEVDLIIGKNHK